MAAYIEHVGYRVQNLDWYLDFFAQVFDMGVEKQKVHENGLREVWLVGGLQLVEDPAFSGEGYGRAHHVCLLVGDLEDCRSKALALGARELPKHHWVELPDGQMVEMFEAAEGTVEALKNLPKRK